MRSRCRRRARARAGQSELAIAAATGWSWPGRRGGVPAPGWGGRRGRTCPRARAGRRCASGAPGSRRRPRQAVVASKVSITPRPSRVAGKGRRISARTTGARAPDCGSGPGRAGHRRARTPCGDDRALGVPGQIRAVEIGQVVVEDARLGRLAGDDVPYRLIQAARKPGTSPQKRAPLPWPAPRPAWGCASEARASQPAADRREACRNP